MEQIPQNQPQEKKGILNKIKKVLRAGTIVAAGAVSQIPAPAQAQYLDSPQGETTSWSQPDTEVNASSYNERYNVGDSYSSDYTAPHPADTTYEKAMDSYVGPLFESDVDPDQQKKVENALKESGDVAKEVILGKQGESLLTENPENHIRKTAEEVTSAALGSSPTYQPVPIPGGIEEELRRK